MNDSTKSTDSQSFASKNHSSFPKDSELVTRAASGDEDAAELLVKRYYASILRYCRWHCPDMETAKDLTQETFIRLFRHLRDYKAKGQFKAWLYTIANRLCIDESRKVNFSPLEDQHLPPVDDSRLHRIENIDQITGLLKLLSPEQKEAVLLRYQEQLSFSEIAKVTGCSLRTAQSRVRNGLKIMRKELNHA